MLAILLLPITAPWAGFAQAGFLVGAALGVVLLAVTTCRWMIKGEQGWARLAGLVPFLISLGGGGITVLVLYWFATTVQRLS